MSPHATTSPRAQGVTGTVFDVQRASFHNGPGIRTTVFLKGCPMSCPWCHNPEGLAPWPEVLIDERRCIGCGSCRIACPGPAGPLPAGARLGDAGCLACRACVDACPSGARQVAGRTWTVAELVAEVDRDRLAYDTSGGGVTFSGGEPLAQPEFLIASLDACRSAGVRTAVDTCGLAPREVVLAVAARTGLLLWDIKHADERRHRELTGAPLAPILANLAAASAAGVPIWLRVPVIPGVNDDEVNLREIAGLAAATTGVRKVSLLPYHRTGAGKAKRLGRDDGPFAATTPSDARMIDLAGVFRAAGLEATIGG